MRVVFIGASKFGLRCLDLTRGLRGCEVVGVVTAPQTFSISYRPQGVTNVLYADVAGYAAANSLPYVVMVGGMNDPPLFRTVAAWRPDCFLVAGWYHMVPKAWRALAPAYGLHASLLPDYCGGAPLVWAIINGEERAGISLFRLAEGVDDGPLYGQAEEPIRDNDTIATLYARIEEHGLGLLRDILPKIASGAVEPKEQDASRRRVFPQRSPEDGRIDWALPARGVFNFVRAQTRPYPGAFALFEGEKVHVWRARLAGEDGAGFRVVCGDGRALELEEIGYQGGTMSGAEFLSRIGKEQAHEARFLG
ncbi:MAG: methionyl-tRNA formyltransferase [Azospirillum sp.]|nr:methionyl-tRNA formyltransferase [Azospirillum sp.]